VEPVPLGIIVAVLGGLAVGIERQWSGHATGPRARFAGVRTFALLGGAAGVSGWLWLNQAQALSVVLLAAAAGVVVVAYASASRTEVEATTEVSALVVLAAGVLGGLGHLALSGGIAVATSFVLLEKSRLHRFVHRLDDESLRAAVRFAVMATVVLPVLPSGPYGPWGTIRPRELWLLVLFFSGISFVSFLARRAVGARYGYPIAGLLGGFISSTNVTLTYARASHGAKAIAAPLAYGTIAASTVLFARVAVATAVLNPALVAPLAWFLLAPFIAGALAVATGIRHMKGDAQEVEPPRNPLQIGAALQMAALFQVVIIAVELARRTWGDRSVLVSGAVLGLTDVDALTITMARGARANIPLELAVRGIATGILSNTILKIGVALVVGRGRFRLLTSAGLLAMAIALGAVLVWR
jgi:uncharacterized membrane protein (DUF4010 family)